MANKRRCKQCKEYVTDFVLVPAGAFCSLDHAVEFAQAAQAKARARLIAKVNASDKREKKAARAQHRKDKERVKTRREWYDQLQRLVNQYVVNVRDKGLPCSTCGTSADVKYDAGHWLTRGARPELRFNLYGINIQCSLKCNIYASGAKQEHELYIAKKHGPHIVLWLKSNQHPSLKEMFPHFEDIKLEMIRYRKLLRAAGVRPNA